MCLGILDVKTFAGGIQVQNNESVTMSDIQTVNSDQMKNDTIKRAYCSYRKRDMYTN